MMRGYAEPVGCRREYLLNSFGDEFAPPCGRCDNCESGLGGGTETGAHHFALNSQVVHRVWGEGQVMRYEGDKMVVLFETVGYRTLGVGIVLEEGLLEQAS